MRSRKRSSGTWSQSSTATNVADVRPSAWLMLPALAPLCTLRRTYPAPQRLASCCISRRLPSSSRNTRTSAPRRRIAACTVGPTMSTGSL
ncbi:MAG: hypothetical protein QM733_14795 [Ilumatobacteraceae bacterium]